MIIINMKDGLGNQFFEYGFARYLQKLHGGEKVVINNFFFDGKKRKRYSLHHFKLSDDIVVAGKFMQLWYTLCFVVRLVTCYKMDFVRWVTSKKRPKGDETYRKAAKKGMYVNFQAFHAFDIPKSKKRVKFIYGNYENYKYIEPVLDELRKEFEIKSAPSEENVKMAQELKANEAVCVHIRRGDYLDPQWKSLNVCTFDYYQNAMDEVQRLRPDAKFYVFSNTHKDLEWIKENYHFKQEVNYVDLGNTDYEELRLMSNCSHFIISNSTFSWWAAVLAQNSGKVVVAPEKWILNNENEDCQGLYLNDWIKAKI